MQVRGGGGEGEGSISRDSGLSGVARGTGADGGTGLLLWLVQSIVSMPLPWLDCSHHP
jgi:hypothetical protein